MLRALAAVMAAALSLALPGTHAAFAAEYEQAFLAVREAGDSVRVAEARGLEAGALRARYAQLLAAFRARLPVGETPAIVREIGARLVDGSLDPLPAGDDGASDDTACTTPPGADADADALQRYLYACYGAAAAQLRVDGVVRDRLSVLYELARAQDPARREILFRAMEPLFRSVTIDARGASPYRQLQAALAPQWRAGDSPIEQNLRALAIEPDRLEPWLVSILEAWRDLAPAQDLEPWDYEYAGSPVERQLGELAARARFEHINAAYYASLGADPAQLNIHYDLAPRPGKTAVAFTDFGARPQQRADGSWSSGEPWVFASYGRGGIGNLNELLHETGHAIHIAAIRTSPAFADWPDSDALTEAIAEIYSQETYEAAWQTRWLGASASLADNLKSRYSGIVLDVAWGLFELRVFADAAREPNAVWTEITRRYLHVRPHPELAWWARRGQLVDSPGYMMNYALGAILAADLRARVRAGRGSPSTPDAGQYPWLAENLLRFGRTRTSAVALREFLGRAPDPAALLADMRRRDEL